MNFPPVRVKTNICGRFGQRVPDFWRSDRCADINQNRTKVVEDHPGDFSSRLGYSKYHLKDSHRLPIIMYHSVKTFLANDPMSPEGQIKSFIKTQYHFVFVKEIPRLLADWGDRSFRPAALTFDDGYEDFYTDVLPILKKYQAKATLYMICGKVGQKGYLDWKQLRQINASGLVEVGAHTLTHPVLTDQKIAVAEEQIFKSKEKLEKMLGIPVETFCYPYGFFSGEVVTLVKAAGFKAAVSTVRGVDQSPENQFYLSRVRPGYYCVSLSQKISYLKKNYRPKV